MVRFARPVDAEEGALRFVVVEDRDDRVLVSCPAQWSQFHRIAPTFCYAKSDIELVHFPINE